MREACDGACGGKGRVFLILRRSRIDGKQDLETEEMLEIGSDIERVESKITPSRLRAD